MRVFQILCLVLVILVINSNSVFSSKTAVCESCGGCLSVKSSDGKLVNCASPSENKVMIAESCHSCDCCGGCISILLNDNTFITCKESSKVVLKDKTVVQF